MKDTIVSVRMPNSLVKELKDLAKENHYVDLSEELRDVIRRKCAQQLEKPKPKPEPSEEKQKLVNELNQIIEQLRKGM